MFPLPKQSCPLDTQIDNSANGAFDVTASRGQAVIAESFLLKSGVFPKIFVHFFQRSLWRFSFPGQFFPDRIGNSINIAIPKLFPNLCGELSAFLV